MTVRFTYLKRIYLPVGLAGCLLVASGLADVRDLGEMATSLEGNFEELGKLIVGISYLGGVGFGIAAVYKFKQYKDNPTQIPVSTPFALMLVSVLMVFLPGFSDPIAQTLFGTTDGMASFTSSQSSGCNNKLPGSEGCST